MLPRPRYERPDFIHDALNSPGLMNAYLARPPYQQNAYMAGSLAQSWKPQNKKE